MKFVLLIRRPLLSSPFPPGWLKVITTHSHRPLKREKNREVNFSHTPHFISPVQQAAQTDCGAKASGGGESVQGRAAAEQNDTHRRRDGGRVSIEDRWNTVQSAACGISLGRERTALVGSALTPSNSGRCSAWGWGASADSYCCYTYIAQELRRRQAASVRQSIGQREQKAISATNLRRPSLFQVPPSPSPTTMTPWRTLYFMVPSLSNTSR